MRSRRRLTGVLVLACAAGLVAGCTSGGAADPGVSPSVSAVASPSPEPSVDPVEVAKAENIAEAEALYRDYHDAYNAVGADGGKDWGPRVLPYLDSEQLVSMWTQWWTQIVDLGYVFIGKSTVASFTVTDYEGEASAPGQVQTVRADVCLDNSELEMVDGSGKVVSSFESGPRVIVKVELRSTDDAWFVVADDTTTDAC